MMAPILLLLSSFLLHPAQESLAEFEYNEETQRLEIALRLSIADEQQLLRSESPLTMTLLLRDPPRLEKAALSVLRKRLRFSDRGEAQSETLSQADAARYRWLGRQEEGGHAWWFFEYVAPASELVFVRSSLFEAPARRAGQTPNPAAHDHVHASPVSTFVLLNAKGVDPKSFTTTPERPTARIPW